MSPRGGRARPPMCKLRWATHRQRLPTAKKMFGNRWFPPRKCSTNLKHFPRARSTQGRCFRNRSLQLLATTVCGVAQHNAKVGCSPPSRGIPWGNPNNSKSKSLGLALVHLGLFCVADRGPITRGADARMHAALTPKHGPPPKNWIPTLSKDPHDRFMLSGWNGLGQYWGSLAAAIKRLVLSKRDPPTDRV